MKRTALHTASFLLLFVASLTALGLGAAVDSPRSLMSPGDYAVVRQAIEAEARGALGRCRALEGSAREICRAEARAEERVKRADAAAVYLGTVSAQADARLARVKAGYDVARARCAVQAGDQRQQCVREARTRRDRDFAQAPGGAT